MRARNHDTSRRAARGAGGAALLVVALAGCGAGTVLAPPSDAASDAPANTPDTLDATTALDATKAADAPDLPATPDGADPTAADACMTAPPPRSERLVIGLADSNANLFTNAGLDRFFTASDGSGHRRVAHVYAWWDVALRPPDDPRRVALQTWLDRAACHGVEALVAFTPVPGAALPVPAEYDRAFVAFRAAWPTVQAFTAWNEPNGPASWPDSARTAADVYLRARSHCRPEEGCVVAAGDMAATVAGNTAQFAMASGPDAPCGTAACSWLDRYKFSLDADGANYGLPHHRPEVWAVHTWADAFDYQRNGEHCGGAARCVTRAFLASLEGSWRRAEVWMTETGAVYEGPDDAARARTQDCAGRFLQRLFAIDPRITRWYYYSFAGVGATGDSGACPFVSLDRGACTTSSGRATRAIFDTLRDRQTAALPGCP